MNCCHKFAITEIISRIFDFGFFDCQKRGKEIVKCLGDNEGCKVEEIELEFLEEIKNREKQSLRLLLYAFYDRHLKRLLR